MQVIVGGTNANLPLRGTQEDG